MIDMKNMKSMESVKSMATMENKHLKKTGVKRKVKTVAYSARRQRAFSLIEMIVSLLLTSLILLALLQIAAGTRLSDRALAAHKTEQADRESLFKTISHLIEADLSQASEVSPSEPNGKQFSMTTSHSLSRHMKVNHLKSSVTYRIESLNGRPFLLREQSPVITETLLIQNKMLALRQSEWIAADIAAIKLTIPEKASKQATEAENKHYAITFEYKGENKRETYTRSILLP